MRGKLIVASILSILAGILVMCLQMIFSFFVWFFTIFLCTWYGVAIIMIIAFIVTFICVEDD